MARQHVKAASRSPSPVWQEFSSPGALARSLARQVAGVLSDAIDRKGRATLAVSGGSTPAAFFRELSGEAIDWSQVTVTLVDERFVPLSSARSNARLVTVNLLQNHAAKARFEGLYEPFDDAEVAASEAARRLAITVAPPFDAVILGMGKDGHTASFFPDAAELRPLLDPDGGSTVKAVRSPTAGEARLTWTLPALVSAGFIALHIEGLEKKDVLIAALTPGHDMTYPVSAIFEHANTPVQIFWATGGKA